MKSFYLGIARALLFFGATGATQASTPLWTLTADPSTPSTQVLSPGSMVTINYNVQNQSAQTRRVAVKPMQGVSQTTSCVLAPKGQAGSACVLTLSISGQLIPASGIHGGPALCQTDADGSPNGNQCYQPSQTNSLDITKAVGVGISVNPGLLGLVPGCPTAGVITVHNMSTTAPANDIAVDLGVLTGNVTATSHCPSMLPAGGNCTIDFSAATPVSATDIRIQGSNTSQAIAAIRVDAPLSIGDTHLGGVVFEVNNCNIGKVISDPAATGKWSNQNVHVVTSTSAASGPQNTDAILASPGCVDASQCAAYYCRDKGAEWYLSASDELLTISNALCPVSGSPPYPCIYGVSGTIWSSSEFSSLKALSREMGVGADTSDKPINLDVRCTRAFTP